MSVRVKFLQAACVGLEEFKKGAVVDVTEKLSSQPYFHKLLASGLVVEAEAIKVITAESKEDKQKSLSDKILALKTPSKVEEVEQELKVEVKKAKFKK